MTDSSSSATSFLYPFLQNEEQGALADVLAEVRGSTLQKSREVVDMRRAFIEAEAARLVDAAVTIAAVFAAGKKLLTFGNGGSATDAQDMATDFMRPPRNFGFRLRAPGGISDFGLKLAEKSKIHARQTGSLKSKMPGPLPALALTNDIAVVTGVGNDVGFENVFARQIISLGEAGDIAVGLSTSGESANVLVALERAKKMGLLTIGIAGYGGGTMARSNLDFCLAVSSTYVPRIQEVQATIYHTLWELVQQILESKA